MKINDKNLLAIASASNLATDKEGYLNKRGDVNKAFRKRWVVLKGNLLYYYEKKTDREPVGVVIVEGCTVELSEENEPYCFKLVFHGPGDRTYVFGAETQESMEEWMKCIASAGYDYMKLMVLELKRQVDELTELEKLRKLGLDGNTPTVPPRQRHNPFNGSQKHTSKKLTFREIHTLYGSKIVEEREKWLTSHKSNLVTDNTLILL